MPRRKQLRIAGVAYTYKLSYWLDYINDEVGDDCTGEILGYHSEFRAARRRGLACKRRRNDANGFFADPLWKYWRLNAKGRKLVRTWRTLTLLADGEDLGMLLDERGLE